MNKFRQVFPQTCQDDSTFNHVQRMLNTKETTMIRSRLNPLMHVSNRPGKLNELKDYFEAFDFLAENLDKNHSIETNDYVYNYLCIEFWRRSKKDVVLMQTAVTKTLKSCGVVFYAGKNLYAYNNFVTMSVLHVFDAELMRAIDAEKRKAFRRITGTPVRSKKKVLKQKSNG